MVVWALITLYPNRIIASSDYLSFQVLTQDIDDVRGPCISAADCLKPSKADSLAFISFTVTSDQAVLHGFLSGGCKS